MVLDQAIGREHVAADLAAEIDLELGVLELVVLDALLGHFVFIQFRLELFDGAGAILVL